MSRCPRKSSRNCPIPLAGGLFLLSLLLLTGCAATRPATTPGVRFDPAEDAFAFPNEMHWVYEFDEAGNWQTRHRDPPPTYALHCFPLVRAAREFAYHARFDATLPRADESDYARAIEQVVARPSQKISPPEERILFPGFASLREFSAAYPGLLRARCGSAVSSYLQRGNWRVVFPFTRRGQAKVAGELVASLDRGELPIIHLTEFPMLNHGVLVYDVHEQDDILYFHTYDPNTPETPVILRYYRPNRTFVLPHTPYFYGGDVNTYEVFSGCLF